MRHLQIYETHNNNKQHNAIINCIYDYNVSGLLKYLKNGANVNSVNNNNITPILIATQCGNKQIIKILLEFGADPSIKNYINTNALDCENMSKIWTDEKIQDIILNHNPHAIKDLLKYMNNEKKKQYRYLLDSEELGLL